MSADYGYRQHRLVSRATVKARMARKLESAWDSAYKAGAVFDALRAATTPDLAENCYWQDLLAKAETLRDEMEADVACTIDEAASFGFEPEDFES